MTKHYRVAFALAATALAAPLAAKNLPPASAPLPDLSAMSTKELQALFTANPQRWSNEPCTFGAPVLTALEASVEQPATPLRRLRLFAEALCADREKRYEDGLKLSADIAALTPDDPEIGLAIYFASRLDNVDSALTQLRGLSDTGLGQLTRESYWSVFRTARKVGRTGDLDKLALEWASAGKFAFLDAQLHERVALAAMRAAARSGRADIVDSLLISITSPSSYVDMLTQRTYEPFWPQIEARAGAHLAAVGDENVRVARVRLTNAPEDRDRFSEAAHALHYNGQFEEAIALAQRWRERKAKGVAIEEGDAWALNIEAYAYDSLGQTKQADAVFDELAKYDADEHPWVVNFVINRASRLTGQGRWGEGLKATELARQVADKHGSVYAKLIIARDRACALQRLGRATEAVAELAYLRDNRSEGMELTVQGLMCHGLNDEAAGLLLDGLRDESLRDTSTGSFQTGDLDLFYTASILPVPNDLLADHPELAVELAKYRRAMPEAFIPQASLRRVPLKQGAGE